MQTNCLLSLLYLRMNPRTLVTGKGRLECATYTTISSVKEMFYVHGMALTLLHLACSILQILIILNTLYRAIT